MRNQVEALLKGAFDFRIHTGPEPDGERRTDYLEAGRDAYEAEMAGFVLMKHRHPTALAAYALNRMYPGFHAVGSIVLNTSVGGLNPDAVEAAAKLGAKVVWMPTQDAGTIGLLDAPDDVEAVLEVAKTHGMAVASTHASFADTEILVDLANSMGLVRLLVTNPVARFGVDEGRLLALPRSVRRVALPVVLWRSRRRGTPTRRYRQNRGRPLHRLDGLRSVDESSACRGDADGNRRDARRGNDRG